MCSGNSWKILIYTKLIFSQYNIFTNTIISFSNPFSDLESGTLIIGLVCIVARLVFVFCCALTTGCRNVLQYNFGNKKKSRVLRPKSYLL